jgi:hypothetical protein
MAQSLTPNSSIHRRSTFSHPITPLGTKNTLETAEQGVLEQQVGLGLGGLVRGWSFRRRPQYRADLGATDLRKLPCSIPAC